MKKLSKKVTTLILVLFIYSSCSSKKVIGFENSNNIKYKVLGVIAHPDDETTFSATWFSIAKLLNGITDLIVVTNGEGGYKYSTLGEFIYNAELTEESIGRSKLPEIRKKELRDAGDIIGIRDITHFNEKDHRYTKDEQEVLNGIWNTEEVKKRIKKQILKENYDAIFVLFPSEETHGHHKAATILTLEAVNELEESKRPVVLASSSNSSAKVLKNYPLRISSQSIYSFDRTKKFGFKDKLDFNIITTWHIAAHKSQGTLQLFANKNSKEEFWALGKSSTRAIEKVNTLFKAIDDAVNKFQDIKKEY